VPGAGVAPVAFRTGTGLAGAAAAGVPAVGVVVLAGVREGWLTAGRAGLARDRLSAGSQHGSPDLDRAERGAT